MASKHTEISLIAGGSYAEREAWIAATLERSSALYAPTKSGVLLEGLPAGQLILENTEYLSVERIAPGCFCCIGQIAMRVTLHRLLRQELVHLYIAIHDAQHLPSLRDSLSHPQYAEIVKCENEIII